MPGPKLLPWMPITRVLIWGAHMPRSQPARAAALLPPGGAAGAAEAAPARPSSAPGRERWWGTAPAARSPRPPPAPVSRSCLVPNSVISRFQGEMSCGTRMELRPLHPDPVRNPSILSFIPLFSLPARSQPGRALPHRRSSLLTAEVWSLGMASWGKMKFMVSLPSLSLVKYWAEGTNQSRCESGVNTRTGDTHTRLPQSCQGVTGQPGTALLLTEMSLPKTRDSESTAKLIEP